MLVMINCTKCWNYLHQECMGHKRDDVPCSMYLDAKEVEEKDRIENKGW